MAIDPKRGEGLLLAVPFRDDYAIGRGANWAWLKRYWEIELPGAQIVVGTDYGEPFSKTCAVNDAFRQSWPTNDIIVMIDADCYISPIVILNCAEAIRDARRWHEPLWFVPYRSLFRLTPEATGRLIASDPAKALQFTTPPSPWDVGSTLGSGIGHRYGALIQIFPREAFVSVGGCDPRFRGWGRRGRDHRSCARYIVRHPPDNPKRSADALAYGYRRRVPKKMGRAAEHRRERFALCSLPQDAARPGADARDYSGMARRSAI